VLSGSAHDENATNAHLWVVILTVREDGSEVRLLLGYILQGLWLRTSRVDSHGYPSRVRIGRDRETLRLIA